MDSKQIAIALNEMYGVGWKSIASIVSSVDRLESIVGMDEASLMRLGLTRGAARTIAGTLQSVFVESTLRKYAERSVHLITMWDEAYPALLREIADPPWVLYGLGDISLLQSPQVAVVGTRTPSPYGRKAAYDLSKSLASCGFCVVSGLARGVDGEAHRGALDAAAGGTIAVLGCSVDIAYPKENAAIYERVASKGLLLSEYPLTTPAVPGLFPQRNRIIAGLSLGTLVIEAAKSSGSLITADVAVRENRDVFALPGSIFSTKSIGTNDLIKNGAKLVSDVSDIVDEYADRIKLPAPIHNNNPIAGIPLLPEEQKVIRFLSHEPMPIDRLIELSETTFGHLHTILLSLLMKNMIEQLPGTRYVVK